MWSTLSAATGAGSKFNAGSVSDRNVKSSVPRIPSLQVELDCHPRGLQGDGPNDPNKKSNSFGQSSLLDSNFLRSNVALRPWHACQPNCLQDPSNGPIQVSTSWNALSGRNTYFSFPLINVEPHFGQWGKIPPRRICVHYSCIQKNAPARGIEQSPFPKATRPLCIQKKNQSARFAFNTRL